MTTIEILADPTAQPRLSSVPIGESRPWTLRHLNGTREPTSPRALLELARDERLRHDDVIEIAHLEQPIPVVEIQELMRLVPDRNEHALQRAYRILIATWALFLLPLAGLADLATLDPHSVIASPDWRIIALFLAFAIPMFVLRYQLVRLRNARLARDPLYSDAPRQALAAILAQPGATTLAIAALNATLWAMTIALKTPACIAALAAHPIDLPRFLEHLLTAPGLALSTQLVGMLAILLFIGRPFENVFGPTLLMVVCLLGGTLGVTASAFLDPTGGYVIPGTLHALGGAFCAFALRARDREPLSHWQLHGPFIEPYLGLALLIGLGVPATDQAASLAGLLVGIPIGMFIEPRPEIRELLARPVPGRPHLHRR